MILVTMCRKALQGSGSKPYRGHATRRSLIGVRVKALLIKGSNDKPYRGSGDKPHRGQATSLTGGQATRQSLTGVKR